MALYRHALAWGLALPAALLAWQDRVAARGFARPGLDVLILAGPPAAHPGSPERPQTACSTVKPDRGSQVVAKARASLVDQPLSAPTIMALMHGKQDEASRRALAQLALRVTRRDSVAQLYLMQDAARQKDDARGLVHLDRVLTVSPATATVVHPVMAKALSEEPFRKALTAYGKRPWFRAFVSHAVGAAPDTGSAAVLLSESGVQGEDWFAPQATRLIGRLANEGRVDAARQFAVDELGARADVLDMFDFTPGTTAQATAPLTWELARGMNARTVYRKNIGVEIEVDAGRSVLALRRTTALAPGSYWFDQTLAPGAAGSPLRMSWQMACINQAARPVRWSQPVPYQAVAVRYRSSLAIEPGCSVQEWRFRVTAPEGFEVGQLILSAVDLVRQ